MEDTQRFANLTYEDFCAMASNESLSRYEKIGFPNSYRENYEEKIFEDILAKLPALSKREQMVLDIGPGLSDLPGMLINQCQKQGHQLLLADGPEILDRLPEEAFIQKFPGRFPHDCGTLFEKFTECLNAIICYSVFHYIFVEDDVFTFVDKAITLLAPGGRMLIGDIPNISKRKRFFSSATGIAYHQAYTGTNEVPVVNFEKLEPGKIDDCVLLSLMTHCRKARVDTYLLPQGEGLPMANRREDLLLIKN